MPQALVCLIDACDPQTCFAHCRAFTPVWLDSAQSGTDQSRYSFIAVDPFERVIVDEFYNKKKCPFDLLAGKIKEYPLEKHPDLPPFQGGVAGMFAYELGAYLERLPRANSDTLHFPELIVGLYDVVIAWDHYLKKTWIFSSGYPEQDPQKRLMRAQERLQWLKDLISHPPSKKTRSSTFLASSVEANYSPEAYIAAVEEVKNYIVAGDIFQANIAQCFRAKLCPDFDAFELYCTLRTHNPAPFSAFMEYQDCAIVSASPERFLLLDADRTIQARPIKGTIRRSKNKAEDQAFAQALLACEKNRAENIMIVDLMRNDLSRVCLPHTVKVPMLCGLESFATVHHLVSVVEGELAPQYTAIDLLKATFPGGSVTGAPKIRAMEIIAEIEPVVRGPYCGSMGYIGFDGSMDLSIIIRSFVIRSDTITFHAGGAVTVESDPQQEYQESLVKARALKEIL